jgi:NAD-dependent deacetylase sirtuin 2
VFFGENLPARFFTSAINDFPKCEALIIIGTSLVVQPFASMIHEVSDEVPHLLINLESVGQVSKRERAHGGQGLSYNEPDNVRFVLKPKFL